MLTDLLVIVLVIMFGALGWRSGTIKQVTHWAGLALGRAAARPLAFVVTLMLVKDFGFIPLEYRIGLSVLIFFTFYAVGTSIARFFLKRFIAHRVHTKVDKTGGFVLGFGKGAVVMFVLLSFLASFQKPLTTAFGRPSGLIGNSLFMTLVSRNNFFGASPVGKLRRLSKLMDAARDPQTAKALAADPQFRDIFDDPKLMASLKDDALAEAIEHGHWNTLKKDPRVAMLLDDPKVMGVLSDPLNWEEQEQ